MKKQPRTFWHVVLSILRFPFQVLRTALVVFLMAVARAFGGQLRIPKPEPRNLPCEVEKKK